jgi:hypothetical protein
MVEPLPSGETGPMPLSNSTYGKAPAMADLTGFADRMTAALENGLGAVNKLNDGIATGAPVDQSAVNTLLKVMQDLGEIANDTRQAGVEASQPDPSQASADANRAATTTGTDAEAAGAKDSGSASTSKNSASTTSKS